ncbi:olfactomedin-4-like [Trichechus manatus latirostris]|uniref:Olfactomedin-4-like n=1 Tax=Trichechus manatus latirostris TaxID=127582 RepID=A0A2Y9RZ47_TRIMA|nr:olfactomedin-4-like [Trichechus manatus latirostris]
MQLIPALPTNLLLLPLVLPGQPQIPKGNLTISLVNGSQIQPVHELVTSMPASMVEGDTCHCVVHLPNNTIPLQQLEKLQSTAQELMEKYEQELSRILEMIHKLQSRNSSALPSSYEALAFNLLHLELEGAQQLVTQLKANGEVNGSTVLLNKLQGQLNWRGFAYKAGTWGRDLAPNPPSSHYWVAPLRTDGRCFDYYRLYKSSDDLMLTENYEEWKMDCGDGTGNTVYKNFMYFNYYGTADMAKVDLSSDTLVLWRPSPGATYNNLFSYAVFNASTLEVEKTWHTNQYKPALSRVFMACGVLYALCSLSTRQKEIFYAFDTITGQERHLSILLDKMLETLQGINYCPSDHKLYVYNDGYLITYDLTFQTLKHQLPRLPAKRPSGIHAPPKPVKPNTPVRPRGSRACSSLVEVCLPPHFQVEHTPKRSSVLMTGKH